MSDVGCRVSCARIRNLRQPATHPKSDIRHPKSFSFRPGVFDKRSGSEAEYEYQQRKPRQLFPAGPNAARIDNGGMTPAQEIQQYGPDQPPVPKLDPEHD